MACSTCPNKAVSVQAKKPVPSAKLAVQQSSEPCEYSVDMLFDFRDKLVWFKEKGLYIKYKVSAKVVNKYTGIVLTSLNISNRCMYKDVLDKVSDLVDLIISIQNEE